MPSALSMSRKMSSLALPKKWRELPLNSTLGLSLEKPSSAVRSATLSGEVADGVLGALGVDDGLSHDVGAEVADQVELVGDALVVVQDEFPLVVLLVQLARLPGQPTFRANRRNCASSR